MNIAGETFPNSNGLFIPLKLHESRFGRYKCAYSDTPRHRTVIFTNIVKRAQQDLNRRFRPLQID